MVSLSLPPPATSISVAINASGSKGAGGWVSALGLPGHAPSAATCAASSPFTSHAIIGTRTSSSRKPGLSSLWLASGPLCSTATTLSSMWTTLHCYMLSAPVLSASHRLKLSCANSSFLCLSIALPYQSNGLHLRTTTLGMPSPALTGRGFLPSFHSLFHLLALLCCTHTPTPQGATSADARTLSIYQPRGCSSLGRSYDHRRQPAGCLSLSLPPSPTPLGPA
jgi:hypothetical protein